MTSLFGWPVPADYDADDDGPLSYPTCVKTAVRARDQHRVSIRAEALRTLPPPMECEAFSSWASRAALSQGVTLNELLTYLGWGARGRDLDLWLGEWFHDTPFRNDELFRPLEHARQMMAGLVAGQWVPAQLLLGDGADGRCRFCPKCLGDDIIPFFKQEWRLDAWRVCWTHSCLMEDYCPSCGKPPALPFSMLYAADRRGVGLLDECRYCGDSLSAAKPVPLEQAKLAGLDPWGLTLLHNGRALVSALLMGHFRVHGIWGDAPQTALRAFVSRALLPRPATATNAAYPPLVSEFRGRLAGRELPGKSLGNGT